MPIPVWPAFVDADSGLPLPNFGFGGNTKTPVRRTEMDAGNVRQLVRYPTQYKTFKVSWNMTDRQKEEFDAFFTDDLVNGTSYFTIPLPSASGFVDTNVRFINATYDDNNDKPDNWQVNAQWEREIVSTLADPETNPLPKWYQPEISIDESIEITGADSLKLYKVTPEAAGTVIILQDPDENLYGQIIGVQLLAPGGVLLTNVETNLPPVGLTVLVTGTENTVISGSAATTDPNGDTITYGTGTTAPGHGDVTDVDTVTGDFEYTPDTDFVGTDSFTIQASDGAGGITQILVVVTVEAAAETWEDVALELGAACYFRGDSGISSPSAITTWNDLSGNGRHLTDSHPSGAGKRATQSGGRVVCTRSTDKSYCGSFASFNPAEYTVIAHIETVTKPGTSNNTWLMATYQAGSNAFDNQTFINLATDGSGNTQYGVGIATSSATSVAGIPLVTNGYKAVYGMEQRKATSPTRNVFRFTVDGGCFHTSSGTPQNMNRLAFGGRTDKASFTADCKIAAVVVFDNPSQFDDPVKRARLMTLIELMQTEFA